MTKTEKYIYDYAISLIPSMIEDLKKKSRNGFIKYPFFLDGSIDSVVFHVNSECINPIHIEYNSGVGNAYYSAGSSTAYFDEFEIRLIPIKKWKHE